MAPCLDHAWHPGYGPGSSADTLFPFARSSLFPAGPQLASRNSGAEPTLRFALLRGRPGRAWGRSTSASGCTAGRGCGTLSSGAPFRAGFALVRRGSYIHMQEFRNPDAEGEEAGAGMAKEGAEVVGMVGKRRIRSLLAGLALSVVLLSLLVGITVTCARMRQERLN